MIDNLDSESAVEYHNKRTSGPVHRPVEELVNYAKILEAILHGVTPDGYFSDEVLETIQNYVCPHWMDILRLN